MSTNKKLNQEQKEELLNILKKRFEMNMHRHKNLEWSRVEDKLKASPAKLWSLNEMESTGGEPDVVQEKKSEEIVFYDCSAESPKGRRSLCYDRAALEARKKHKPENSAMDRANEMGIEILNEEQYRELQSGLRQDEKLDAKTSSWIKTPEDIRKLGGALFCDYRYAKVFVYHNGADSYYSARGFRGLLKL